MRVISYTLLFLLLAGCNDKLPPVENENGRCTKIDATAINSAGYDMVCADLGNDVKRWVRVG